MPVRVPAGGISSRPVTPRSAIAGRHRSQRTGEATWATRRRSTSLPSWTTCPSALESSRVRGSWVEIESGQRGQPVHSRGHVHRVEGTGHAERDQPGPGRRVRPPGPRAARVVPAATIWPEPLLFAAVSPWPAMRGQHLLGVAADHRGHRRRR